MAVEGLPGGLPDLGDAGGDVGDPGGDDGAADGIGGDAKQRAKNSLDEQKQEQHRYRTATVIWLLSGSALSDCLLFSICIWPHVIAMQRSLWVAGK
eukprot:7146792-Pyramimonas_sp.AAC.1